MSFGKKYTLLLLAMVVAPADAIWFPALRCGFALYWLGFDIGNFDKYDDYFHDDSVVQLAQTGSYEGADDIEEYVKFTFAEYSPYLSKDGPILKTGFQFLGYQSETGQCVFRGIELSGYFLDAETSAGLPPFDAIKMAKLYLDFKEVYFTRLNVFYPVDFLRVFFGVGLSSDNTRSYICDVMDGEKCGAILNSTSDCKAFASTNPDPNQHCPHISFQEIPDARDRVKCQDTSNVLPSDLFTDKDFAGYRAFAEKNGIDPELGHDSTF